MVVFVQYTANIKQVKWFRFDLNETKLQTFKQAKIQQKKQQLITDNKIADCFRSILGSVRFDSRWFLKSFFFYFKLKNPTNLKNGPVCV